MMLPILTIGTQQTLLNKLDYLKMEYIILSDYNSAYYINELQDEIVKIDFSNLKDYKNLLTYIKINEYKFQKNIVELVEKYGIVKIRKEKLYNLDNVQS